MKSFVVLTAVVCAALAFPQADIGEPEFVAEEHAQTVGTILKKIPDILSKTAEWIRNLGEIGNEVHPDVGSAIKEGADAIEEASKDSKVTNLHGQFSDHLKTLINITKSVQEQVNSTLRENLPEIKDKLRGLPGDDYILDVVESIPSPDYVDEQIQEAINYFEPLAEAIAAEGKEN